MKKFIWVGPHHMAEVHPAPPKDGAAAGKPKPLFQGWLGDKTPIELPEDHTTAKAWIARGWLKPAEAPAADPAADGKPASDAVAADAPQDADTKSKRGAR